MIGAQSAEASTSLPRRLAAVWFADIVGYTRLAAEDENAALAAVQRFQEIVREVVEARLGVTGLQVNPRFDALREDPRFQAILARVGLDHVPPPAGAA